MPSFGPSNSRKSSAWERVMPSFGPDNVERSGEQVVLAASAPRTTSGSGAAIYMGAKATARVDLAVTAVSGTTPSATVTIEHSANGSTGWTSAGAFTAATGVSAQRKVFSGLDNYIRASWTVTGTTPSLTFSVVADVV